MTPEQKQQAQQLIADWTNVSRTSTPAVWFLNGDCMAGFLQELVDAPEPELVAWNVEGKDGETMCVTDNKFAADRYIACGYVVEPLYTAPPAPSVTDEQLQAAFDRGLKAGNEQGIAQQVEIHKLHKILAAAPTPAEAPAQDFEDALEQAFWDFDARHKGYKKNIRPISEREAFKQILRNFVHEHGGAEAPADVARDAERLDWLDVQCSENNGRHICCLPGGLRVAIDAAMHEKGQS